MTSGPDFSGYWRQVKNEGFDGFLKELGVPWVMRKTAVKYGSNSTDIIWQKGPDLLITTVNAKGSWHRKLLSGKEVTQRNAEGVLCKTSSWWEGSIHKTRMEPKAGRAGPARGTYESWRYMEGGLMVVKSMLHLEGGREATMFWYLESVEDAPDNLLCVSLRGPGYALKRDQKRVRRATSRDNPSLQAFLQRMSKWETPADEYLGRGRIQGRVERDKEARLAAASPLPSPRSSGVSPVSSAFFANAVLHSDQQPGGPAAAQPTHFTKSGSLDSTRATSGTSALPSPEALLQHSGPANGHAVPEHGKEDAGGAVPAEPLRHARRDADEASEARSEGAREPPSAPQGKPEPVSSRHLPAAAAEGLAASRTQLSAAGSDGGGGWERPPVNGSRLKAAGAASREEELQRRLADFADNRSITNVVPLDNPLASNEPELLEMSPEQAEETQLKLQEMEHEVARATPHRQRYAAGLECMCCTCVCHPYTIPHYLRAWDL